MSEEIEEIFDICDEEGIPTGMTVSRHVAHSSGICHRTAHVWIVRKNGGRTEILMQKRSDGKDSYPGCYDTSSAGHIRAGDEPLASAVRELEEELGIYASGEELTYLGKFRNCYEGVFHGRIFRDNECSYVYAFTGKVDISRLILQKEEVSEVRWFDFEYVRNEKRNGNRTFCVPTKGLETLADGIRLGLI